MSWLNRHWRPATDSLPKAARLLGWVQTIQPEQMLGCFTPVIEDQRERGIGIASPWGNDNFPAYLQMLVDEINEKTHYNLRLQPWKRILGTQNPAQSRGDEN